jgi:hypothetical protein
LFILKKSIGILYPNEAKRPRLNHENG